MKELTDFGRAVKHRLIDINQTQKWLEESVSQKTGLYFDRSYMGKILTGQLSTPKVVSAIKEILDLPE